MSKKTFSSESLITSLSEKKSASISARLKAIIKLEVCPDRKDVFLLKNSHIIFIVYNDLNNYVSYCPIFVFWTLPIFFVAFH
ncbi:hypothetical protein GvMRE_IIg55 [endosymbiont GvMRE of Glomus versiforme]|nr:hypothetical protein GvMRE_IIg55 [endosymbiont GvMRE of Glomus versiforme]